MFRERLCPDIIIFRREVSQFYPTMITNPKRQSRISGFLKAYARDANVAWFPAREPLALALRLALVHIAFSFALVFAHITTA